ncbi:hypothetical protein MPDQ_007720 [Monascus purpureus]|uniref:HAM1-like N-terminal domain-containing protein n=1 Tax=Monascus purpureus TaxID=5098 RepID=A0A507QRJ3_MONPU|nr:hypothetical protein MPDQ_002352 [Monascus purpureus]TQB71248.1 hypothetical protein MPDQ_007720 [Monascus purpureus]BDD63125.1 hypothetical protein MAP00_008063 [Monascus purpureus]
MPPDDTEPLLPTHEDAPSQVRPLHRKLHSYLMLRALSDGYMPSTEQAIANLRALLASDALNSNVPDISRSGRQLLQDSRLWLQTFIDLLREKNSDDKLQEFLWRLSQQSRALRDTPRASQVGIDVDPRAAYDSLHALASLLLTNAEFRLFVDDLATVGRQIFADTSSAVSEASQQVASQVRPSQQELDTAHTADVPEGHGPSEEDVRGKAKAVAGATQNGVIHARQKAADSTKENVSGEQREILFSRLRRAVAAIRERPGYSDTFEALMQLGRRYVRVYSSAAEKTVSISQEADADEEFKQTVRQFWALLRSFGDPQEWESLEQKFNKLVQHANSDPDFQQFLSEIGSAVREMMTDPSFFQSAPQKIDELSEKSKQLASDSSLRQDVDVSLEQAKRTLRTVSEDRGVSQLTNASKKLYEDAWAAYCDPKSRLPEDIAHIILPRLLRTLQYIPIPRLEMASREIDLLVENLVFQPGYINEFTSFLPYRMHLTTRNDIDVLKKHSKRVETDIKTTFTATVVGLNFAATDFGYWVNAHAGPFLRFQDEGIASFYLDKRGIDISLDVEVGRRRLDQVFRLRGVRVHIHKISYQLRRTKHRFLLWLLKPFLKQLIRRVLERQIAERIVEAATSLNRELVFARERLRAVRIAHPPDLATFVRAVLARGTGTGRSEARVDVEDVFRGIYTPSSVVKLWHEEAERAEAEIQRGDHSPEGGKTWRNAAFDVTAVPL